MPLKYHLYIAQTADGFIADASGGLAWFDEFSGTDNGYEVFYAGIEGLIFGRKTYDQVMGMGAWPYPGKPAAVLSRRPIGPNAAAPVRGCPTIADAEAVLESAGTRTIWIVGGGETIAAALRAGIRPERIEVFMMPVLLGVGVDCGRAEPRRFRSICRRPRPIPTGWFGFAGVAGDRREGRHDPRLS